MTWRSIKDDPPPKDGTWIIAKLGDGVPDRWDHWRGRCFVIKHMGYTSTAGYDLGWTLFPGMGAEDDWLAEWQPLPE